MLRFVLLPTYSCTDLPKRECDTLGDARQALESWGFLSPGIWCAATSPHDLGQHRISFFPDCCLGVGSSAHPLASNYCVPQLHWC